MRGAEANSRTAPGEVQRGVLDVAGTADAFGGGGEGTLPEANVCSSSKMS